MATIKYYMTLNSPWSYLGSQRFADLAKKYGCDVDVNLAKFSEIFPKTGGLPLPKRAPARQAYRLMELKRWREVTGLPINLQPKHFPSDEIPGSRLVIAAKLAGKDAHRLATEIGRSLWEREENIGEMSVLEAAAKRAGLDADALLAAGPSAEEANAIHDRMTAEALQLGVFGAPSYVLDDGEFYWGQDRLDLLEFRLKQRYG